MPKKGYKQTEEHKAFNKKRFIDDNPMKHPEVKAKFIGDLNPSKRLEVRLKISNALRGEKHYRYQPIGSECIFICGNSYRTYIKTKNGWINKARYIMAHIIGRKLKSWEDVHHKDTNTLNDDLSNLQIMRDKEHNSYHVKYQQNLFDIPGRMYNH